MATIEKAPGNPGERPSNPSLPENRLVSPVFSETAIQSVAQVLRSGWVGSGQVAEEFESAFAKLIGCEHAVSTSSCSVALEIALRLCHVGFGDEVITSPLTYVASLNAIVRTGATPVLVDIDAQTGNIDLELAANAITPKTKAILPVHFSGHPCDMERLQELKEKNGLWIVQDCAHAIEATWNQRSLGSFPDISCYSFSHNKSLSTVRGGMICLKDSRLAKRARQARQQGLTHGAWQRQTHNEVYYDVVEPGQNGELSDALAALGLTQLKELQSRYRKRREIWQYYQKTLKKTALKLPKDCAAPAEHAYHLYPVRTTKESGLKRDEWVKQLHESQIPVSIHYPNPTRFTFYQSRYGWHRAHLPRCDDFTRNTFSLPLGARMSLEDARRVCDAVVEIESKQRTYSN